MSGEYSDGIAFRYEVPREDLALRGVCIEEGQPVLLFDVSKKVPTLTEQEVAMCIRVIHNDNECPEFFYSSILPNHPLAGTGRHFKYYKPLYMRRTPMGENLAEIDWNMKCLSIDVRTDKSKEKFFSWSKTSNVAGGLLSSEHFDYDISKHSGVYMKCKSVHVFEDQSNQLMFHGEPKMMVDWKDSPGYSNYITEKLDEIAYFDEPLFLKMKEYIKLILVVKWLKEKGFQFSQEWIQEQTKPTLEPPKPLLVELSPEQRNSIIQRLKKEAKKAVKRPQLKQYLTSSKYEDRISVTKPVIKVDDRGFEGTYEQTIPDPSFEMRCDLYVPVVQKVSLRASTHDLDFVYAGTNPNTPVIFDHTSGTPINPDVNSWSELMAETEVFPCKWLQDPNDVMCRTPALTGGVSTTRIPVERVQKPVSTKSCPVKVPASKKKNKKGVRNRDIPTQPIVQAPPCTNSLASVPVATGGGVEMRGYGTVASRSGMSSDGAKINQPTLHTNTRITQLIGGKEVGSPLEYSMHIPLPPKAESECSDDSGYSSTSIPSTPSPVPSDPELNKTADSSSTVNSENISVELDAALRNLDPANASSPAVMAADKDDSSSVISDSGISSSATMDTQCESDSDATIADDDDEGMEL